MRIYVEVSINGIKKYLSPDGFSDSSRWWEPAVGPEIISPSLTIPQVYGGYQAITMGALSIVNSVFKKDNNWPPPSLINDITVRYSDSGDVIHHMFSAVGYLSSVSSEACTYDLYPESTVADLLTSGTDYNGNTIVLPMAIGTAYYFEAARIADTIGGDPQYHNNHLSGTLAKGITAFSEYGGVITVGGPMTTSATPMALSGFDSAGLSVACVNDFEDGDNVIIEDADNLYNGTHEVISAGPALFVIDTPYVGTTTGHAYLAGWWRVYDDGVPISGNATVVDATTFSLDSEPVGSVSVSGESVTGTDLAEVAEYLTALIAQEHLFNSDDARVTLPEISYYATSQISVIDMINLLCQGTAHMFFINDSIAYLVDMETYTDEVSVTYLADIAITMPRPIARITVTANRNDVTLSSTDIIYAENNAEIFSNTPYTFGDDVSIQGVERTDAELAVSLQKIGNFINKTQYEFTVPIDSLTIMPCVRYSVWDPINELTCYVIARNISYDFTNLKAKISGDGLYDISSMSFGTSPMTATQV